MLNVSPLASPEMSPRIPPGAPRARYLPPPASIPQFRLEHVQLESEFDSDNEDFFEYNGLSFIEEDSQSSSSSTFIFSENYEDIQQTYFQKLWKVWSDLWENNHSNPSLEEICWVEHLAHSNGGLRPSLFGNVNRYVVGSIDSCCSVCLDTLTEGDFCAELKCTHRFHSKCLGEWFKSKHCCPNCRHDVSSPPHH
eukprot:c17069_g1_i1.p1 GENE.c17069_g1_i1~~c17069_g1_i1.p1  ORF type:complete len:195 (+),score=71.66 c17069_g1_i1:242-826(+)